MLLLCHFTDSHSPEIFIVGSLKNDNKYALPVQPIRTMPISLSEYESLLLLGAGRKASRGSDCSTTSGVAAETKGAIL